MARKMTVNIRGNLTAPYGLKKPEEELDKIRKATIEERLVRVEESKADKDYPFVFGTKVMPKGISYNRCSERFFADKTIDCDERPPLFHEYFIFNVMSKKLSTIHTLALQKKKKKRKRRR